MEYRKTLVKSSNILQTPDFERVIDNNNIELGKMQIQNYADLHRDQ